MLRAVALQVASLLSGRAVAAERIWIAIGRGGNEAALIVIAFGLAAALRVSTQRGFVNLPGSRRRRIGQRQRLR